MWDTAGQETYQSITAPYFRLCNGVLLVFDLADSESFNKLNYWLDLIHENTKEKPIIFLIGNKVDIGRQSVSNDEIQSFCSKNQIKFFKTSALTGEGVDEVVDEMINQVANECQYTKAYFQRISIDDENEESKGCC